ncbi:hypothetical protein [Pragia fontium]|uniref:hypothetical protein n=1 Tax=Pragia fontium TaxID=82985 RepID=UPI00064A73EC|nr:hypothetical protein [Pragia fontium]AKJ41525.1 hypothetical protein QQ39_05045 [Pragia fontium]
MLPIDFEFSGIATAFKHEPVLAYIVERHGRQYKCFSRNAAINKLAHIMTQKAFNSIRKPSRAPETPIQLEGYVVHQRGETLPEYWACHKRAVRRIRLILNKKREIEKWEENHTKLKQKYSEFMITKPY